MQYTTPSNYKNSPTHQKIRTEKPSDKPTQTVPGEALSIQQMFDKFSKGHPVLGTQRTPIYSENATHEDTDLEKLKDADLVDKEEYSRNLADKMKHLEKEIDANKAKEQAERAEKEEAAFLEKLKKYQQKKSDTESKNNDGVTPH